MKALRILKFLLSGSLLLGSAVAAQEHISSARGFDPTKAYDWGEVDSINLFNGNVTVTLPLGPSYAVSENFSYDLKLVNNSKLWANRQICLIQGGLRGVVSLNYFYQRYSDLFEWVGYTEPEPVNDSGDPQGWRNQWRGEGPDRCRTVSILQSDNNAGVGWALSLGQLVPPQHGRVFIDHENNSYTVPVNESSDYWIYVGPDGAEHILGNESSAGSPEVPPADPDAPVWRSGDMSFLRLRFPGPATASCPLTSDPNIDIKPCAWIDSPDGVVREFRDFGLNGVADWRLRRISDAFGNWVDVAYSMIPGGMLWTITDSVGRSHTIEFEEWRDWGAGGNPLFQESPYRVKEVRLATFSETAAAKKVAVDFRYEADNLPRACPNDFVNSAFRGWAPGQFLTRLDFRDPDTETVLTSYKMKYAGRAAGDTLPINCRLQGALVALTMPTEGRIEWDYGSASEAPYQYAIGISGRRSGRATAGIKEKRVYDRDSATASQTWTYEPRLTPIVPGGGGEIVARHRACFGGISGGDPVPPTMELGDPRCHEKEFSNTVTDPSGVKTRHYFSVYPLGPSPLDGCASGEDPMECNEAGWTIWDLGLPFTRRDKVLAGNQELFLSKEIFEPGVDPATGDPVRKIFVRYEADWGETPPGEFGSVDSEDLSSFFPANFWNRREARQRQVYLDDQQAGSTSYSEVIRSNFDSLGNYRTVEQRGHFNSLPGLERIEFTNYNQTSSGATVVPGDQDRWFLKSYGKRTLTQAPEGGNTAIPHQIQTDEVCFESGLEGPVPFVSRSRRYESLSPSQPNRGTHDVVQVFARDGAGNVIHERLFGGDTQSLGTGPLCQLSLPAKPIRAVEHEILRGVRIESRTLGSCSGCVLEKSPRLTLDASAGMVQSEARVDGLTTRYFYDVLGRLTKICPDEQVIQVNQFVLRPEPTPSGQTALPAGEVLVKLFPASATCVTDPAQVLEEGKTLFDSLGRVTTKAFRQIDPAGNAAGREIQVKTSYDAASRLAAETTPHVTESASFSTTYGNYDTFGRARQVVSPDLTPGTALRLGFKGDRVRTSTVRIKQASGEIDATRQEFFDLLGRLYLVRENSGPTGQCVDTKYTYDVADRIVGVGVGTFPGSECSGTGAFLQERRFVYDGRGFLREETLPELGPNGNGTRVFSEFRADAKPGRWSIRLANGANGESLAMRYDDAGRMIEAGPPAAPAGTEIAAPLIKQSYASITASNVRERGKLIETRRLHPQDRTRPGPQNLSVLEKLVYGRQGRVVRKITATSLGDRFESSFDYNDLGEVSLAAYPSCGQDPLCQAALPSRSVATEYRWGQPFKTTGTSAGVTKNYVTTTHYAPSGRISRLIHGNGVHDIESADPKGLARPAEMRAMKSGNALWLSGAFTYDGAGNIKSIGHDQYVYDPVSRLVSGTVGVSVNHSCTEALTYDGVHNLTSRSVSGSGCRSLVRPAIAVDPATNRLAPSSTTAQVVYDDRGNLEVFGTLRLEYDRLGVVLRSEVPGNGFKRYLYTTDGERVAVLGDQFVRYTLRGLGNEVLRTALKNPGTWELDEDSIYHGGRLVASVPANPAETLHFSLDHLGSVRVASNDAGGPVELHKYLPYGEEVTAPTESQWAMRFTGHERDGDLSGNGFDLDYMHARYFGPWSGRFLSPDTAAADSAKPSTWNRYAYVSGNPMRLVDPNGLYQEDFHYTVTKEIALDLGFSEQLAEQMAHHTQAIDDNWYTNPKKQFFAGNLGGSLVEKIPGGRPETFGTTTFDNHFVSMETFQELLGAALNGGVAEFGEFNHALQDLYSHIDRLEQGFHVTHGPDRPENDIKLAFEAAKETAYFMVRWADAQGIKLERRKMSKELMNRLVDRWKELREQKHLEDRRRRENFHH